MLLSAITLLCAVNSSVTLTEPGANVPKLVQELSKASGVPLFAPKAFETDILAVRLKDAPLKEVLDRIGDLTAADWAPRGDGFELVRSRAKQKAEEDADYQAELATFTKAIAKKKTLAAQLGPWNETTVRTLAQQLQQLSGTVPQNGFFDSHLWDRVQALDQQAPGGRSMARVVATLDPAVLAGLPEGYRIVFSDQPTRLQRPLPASSVSALKDMVAEQNLWADVASRIFTGSGQLYTNAQSMHDPFTGRLQKVLLLITKSSSARDISAAIELQAADAKGKVIVRANAYLSQQSENGGEAPKPEPGEVAIEPTPLAVAIKNQWGTASAGSTGQEIPKPLLDLLVQPEKEEPLALGLGEPLIRVAESKHANLIASLPDESFFLGATTAAQKMTPSMLLSALRWFMMTADESNGWLVIKPGSSRRARLQRTDRHALGKYLRAIRKAGRADLEDQAAFVSSLPGDLEDSIGTILARIVAPSMNDDNGFDQNALRLYGLLEPTQRQALARGGAILLSQLTASEREVIDKMVFGPNPNLYPIAQSAGVDWESFWNGLKREPTELFGDGVPSNSVLKMTDQSDSVLVVPRRSAGNGMQYGVQPLTPDDLAQRLLAKERPGIMPWMDQQMEGDSGKYYQGSRRQIQFTIEFGKVAQTNCQIQDLNADESAPITFDQAPDAFKKEVEAKLVALRKAYAKVKPGDVSPPGQGGPPPPKPMR